MSGFLLSQESNMTSITAIQLNGFQIDRSEVAKCSRGVNGIDMGQQVRFVRKSALAWMQAAKEESWMRLTRVYIFIKRIVNNAVDRFASVGREGFLGTDWDWKQR